MQGYDDEDDILNKQIHNDYGYHDGSYGIVFVFLTISKT